MAAPAFLPLATACSLSSATRLAVCSLNSATRSVAFSTDSMTGLLVLVWVAMVVISGLVCCGLAVSPRDASTANEAMSIHFPLRFRGHTQPPGEERHGEQQQQGQQPGRRAHRAD